MLLSLFLSLAALIAGPNTSELDHFLHKKGFHLNSETQTHSSLTSRQGAQLNALLRDNPWVHSIAQVGFDAGHTAFLFLQNRPQIRELIAFDLNLHTYTPLCVQFLKNRYKTTFEFYPGDSQEQIPEFLAQNPERTFDLFYVDGDHSYENTLDDIIHGRDLVKPKHLLVINHYQDEVYQAVQTCVEEGLIEINQVIHSQTPFHGHRVFITACYKMCACCHEAID